MWVMFKEAWLAEGPMGLLRLFAAMLLKARVNKDKLGRYKRLGLLPEGTLGREYWKHMVRTGFNFPGEPAGIADSVAYHDVAHVLADNAATPLGEIRQGAFQGGNRREDGFFFVQFVILQFHHGIRTTPVAPPDPGHFEPDQVLWAIHRGAKCNVDMTHQWNFWPLMALPLAEARARCPLLPK
jgi:ubiquinone biosynthesis protein Coq4